jgi:putative DNA primase/helicase
MTDFEDIQKQMADDWLPDISDQTIADSRRDKEEIARLASLPPLERDRELKPTATALGVSISALRTEVKKASAGIEGDEVVEVLEPWPDEVVGSSLAEEIRDTLRAHVVFASVTDADAATLWALGSYLMDTWRLYPRLLITSPTKACGKSTCLEVVEAVAKRGLILSNAKSAGVFRAIEAWQPCLLLDEADTWMRQDEELAGILNSGHTRRTARVIRVVEKGGELTPTLFSTWCPMAIAGIGGQRDTLESRSVKIGLRRKLPSETVERMPIDLHERMARVRRQALRWTQDNAIRIAASESEPPECGDDRRRDNFTPLWRIAEALGAPWPERIAAAYLVREDRGDDDNEPAGVMLLRDLYDMMRREGDQAIHRTFFKNRVIEIEDRPWAEWKNGRPITSHAITALLKPFEVYARSVRVRGKAEQGYSLEQVENAYIRYVSSTDPANSATLPQCNENNDLDVVEPNFGTMPETEVATSNPLNNNESGNVAKNNTPSEAMHQETPSDRDLDAIDWENF